MAVRDEISQLEVEAGNVDALAVEGLLAEERACGVDDVVHVHHVDAAIARHSRVTHAAPGGTYAATVVVEREHAREVRGGGADLLRPLSVPPELVYADKQLHTPLDPRGSPNMPEMVSTVAPRSCMYASASARGVGRRAVASVTS